MSTTRRDFLKLSLGAMSGLGAMDGLSALAAPGAAGAPGGARADRDTVLVVVQLAGGNDGLNTVVPYSDDEYAKNRRTLRLSASQVHKIDERLGFHPRLEAFKRLYDEGHLAVVQGVAYPNQNQSHPRSMEIWQTAQPDETNCQTGWLGHLADEVVDVLDEDDPGRASVPAVYVGSIARPFALNAQRVFVPSVRSLRQCTLQGFRALHEEGSGFREERTAKDNPLLQFARESTLAAQAVSQKIEKVALSQGSSAGASGYPPIELAQMLRLVTQLIRAEVGIRVFYTELGGVSPGGFDNHANQADNHGSLLHELSESVAAMVDDLKRDRLLDRVVLMTFSEFGRTLAENGRRGTGHGEAAPMFLAGGKLRGGLVGPHPRLTDLRNGSPKFHTDFRRVYATMLDGWLGFDSQAVLGRRFEPLDVFTS